MPGPLEIRFGGYQGRNSIHTRAARVFGTALADNLGGGLDFQFRENIVDEGRNARDLLDMVEQGALTFCYFSSSYLADRAASFSILDLPFTYNDRSTAYALLDGELGLRLGNQLASETGYRLLNFWDNGFRHFSNGVRPIAAPADCQGLSIRTLFSDLHQDVFRALGFDPIALDVKDLVAGVKNGTVDAQENPLTNIYNFGIHEYHRHITLSSHFFGAAALLCNAAAYRSWDGETRAAVDDAAVKATAEQRRLAAAEDTEILAKLERTDAVVVHLDDTQRRAFRTAVEPTIERQRSRLGDDWFSLLP